MGLKNIVIANNIDVFEPLYKSLGFICEIVLWGDHKIPKKEAIKK